jgi:hypothetical protein
MNDNQLSTPVVIFIYDRPDHTKKVLTEIDKADPPLLFVVADGAANHNTQIRCQKTRDLIGEVEFDCEVKRNFADENLGIRKRFSTGLNWVFNQTPEAIILEDDTVPKQSFFRYCDVLLDRFRNDKRVMEITGRNQLETWEQENYDYHFSYYGGIWGWATWRDAWTEYNEEMTLWDSEVVRKRIQDVISSDDQFKYIENIYDRTASGKINTWDYQWGFARHRNNGLSIVPSKNLIKNIGFDETGTHTTDPSHGFANKDTYELSFPLNHPPFVAPDREYDRQFHQLRNTRSVPKRIFDFIRKKIRR